MQLDPPQRHGLLWPEAVIIGALGHLHVLGDKVVPELTPCTLPLRVRRGSVVGRLFAARRAPQLCIVLQAIDRSEVGAQHERMGHDGGAENRDRHVKAARRHEVARRHIAIEYIAPVGLHAYQEHNKARKYNKHQRTNQHSK